MAKQVKIQASPAAAVAEKPASKTHKVPAGTITGGKPVPNAKEQVKQKAGPEAQGFSLAQSAIAEVRGHGQTWLTYVARLMVLTPEARKYFRDALSAHVKHLNATAGDDKQAKKAVSSAKVRLSELTTLSKALDAGMEIPHNGMDSKGLPKVDAPFYAIIQDARMHLDSEAAGGDKRGRTKDSMVVATIKFVNRREALSDDEKAEKKSLLGLFEKQYPDAWKASKVIQPEEGDPSDGILKNAAKMAA